MGDVHNGNGVLKDIAVDVAHQHQGIGTLLLETELRALRNSKSKIVVAEVHYKCASAFLSIISMDLEYPACGAISSAWDMML